MGKQRDPRDIDVVRHFGISVGNAFEKRLAYWRDLATKPSIGAKHPTSPRAARELCERAANYLEWGWAMPDELRNYLVDALRAVADDGSADKALGIQRHPRMDALDKHDRDLFLVLLVDAWRANGLTKRAAIEKVAKEHLGSDNDLTNLTRIYRRTHERCRRLAPDFDEWRGED